MTGAPLYVEQNGGFLSSEAFEAPALGQWGNAGRNSITGPAQFSLNASLTRTFRVNERVNMDLRVDANNVLNKVTFPDWNTTVNSSQFGLPTRANAMRSLQPTLRVRFLMAFRILDGPRHCPSWPGGVDATSRKISRSFLYGADGVVVQDQQESF